MDSGDAVTLSGVGRIDFTKKATSEQRLEGPKCKGNRLGVRRRATA